ncbi:hypothetical protein FIU85_01415 [Roseovarius sp. THAF8]|uniref:hypothetical protein n=1 Tax=Roseovarius sp. THAF8 TaxID=2587846 RepID=UPI0012697097|nr:hypothetical protein [Roseovarius sp. THAF8]QFT95951.1 hypothetical protein FIU85_01415 [Roseovarius sp. THAF8]
MRKHHLGALPRETNYDEDMIDDLADRLRAVGARNGGVRIEFDWLRDALGGDAALTRRVFKSAGFKQPASEEWYVGHGAKRLEIAAYPAKLADDLADILDDYA